MNGIRKRAYFLKSMVLDHEVGAVTMSSKHVIRDVLECLDAPLRTVVEYGPGEGVMTKALLERLPPNGRLLVVEPNVRFIETLRRIKDKRLEVLEGKVQDMTLEKLREFQGADAVVSSIPFSLLTPAERFSVVAVTHKLLAPGGSFIVFHQYSRLMVRPLKKYFRSVSVVFEPRNILPCFVLNAKKGP